MPVIPENRGGWSGASGNGKSLGKDPAAGFPCSGRADMNEACEKEQNVKL